MQKRHQTYRSILLSLGAVYAVVALFLDWLPPHQLVEVFFFEGLVILGFSVVRGASSLAPDGKPLPMVYAAGGALFLGLAVAGLFAFGHILTLGALPDFGTAGGENAAATLSQEAIGLEVVLTELYTTSYFFAQRAQLPYGMGRHFREPLLRCGVFLLTVWVASLLIDNPPFGLPRLPLFGGVFLFFRCVQELLVLFWPEQRTPSGNGSASAGE